MCYRIFVAIILSIHGANCSEIMCLYSVNMVSSHLNSMEALLSSSLPSLVTDCFVQNSRSFLPSLMFRKFHLSINCFYGNEELLVGEVKETSRGEADTSFPTRALPTIIVGH